MGRSLKDVGASEAALSAACWALAGFHQANTEQRELFGTLAEEHRETAERIGARGARMTEVLSAARALIQLAVSTRATLAWLRDREHALVREYLALDTVVALDDVERARLRREFLPAAYDRYTRVDRMCAAIESEEGVPA